MLDTRSLCTRCLRPTTACFCAQMPAIPSRTRVVFLQHPREFRMPVGTARIAHLSLPNSEIHVGVTFDDHNRLRELAASDDVAVLFPGEGAVDPAELQDNPPRSLIVLDGTWPLAKKLFRVNPILHRLPRIGLQPRRPSNYRIRKEPAEHCVSTIEAVAEVLGQLEGEPDRFLPLLAPFESMVDHQLESKQQREGPGRRRLKKKAPTRSERWNRLAGELRGAVLVYAEANAYPQDSDPHYEPELVHLAALRPSDGARFEAVVAPRNPLASSTPFHLEVSAETLLAGEPLAEVIARFDAFTAGAPLVAWGAHSLVLLRGSGARIAPSVDAREAMKQWRRQKVGSLEDVVASLGLAPEAVWAKGRAGRRIEALARVQRGLIAELEQGRR